MTNKVRHHFLLYPFFRSYINWKMKKNFHQVQLIGEVNDAGNAVLVISNHQSWWDGFWINHLNQALFQRKFCFLMSEEELQKHWYFKFTGGISIKKKSRSVIDSINYSAELLSCPEYLLLIFPQGQFQSMHQSTLRFEKGFESILKKCTSPVQLLFVANIVEFFSNPKPSVFIYYEEYRYNNQNLSDIRIAYQQFYSSCKLKDRSIHSVLVAELDETLIHSVYSE